MPLRYLPNEGRSSEGRAAAIAEEGALAKEEVKTAGASSGPTWGAVPRRGTAARCPYCHADIELEGRVWIACETCLARHHLACWNAREGCGSCGSRRGLSPRADRLAAQVSRWSGGAAWRDVVLVGAVGAALVAALAGALGYQAGQRAEWRRQDDPAVRLAEALVARAMEQRICEEALVEAGRPDLARRLARFHHDAQPQRRRLLHDLAGLLKEVDPAEAERAELKRVLDERLAGALVDIALQD